MQTIKNQKLTNLTSINIGGSADTFYIPQNTDELKELSLRNTKFYVLGGGTNIIFGNHLSTPVISLKEINKSLLELKKTANTVEITAGAGTPLAKLIKFAAENEAAGLDIMAGIPGTVGGAISMNAGVPSGTIGNFIIEVELIEATSGNLLTLSKEEMSFNYRSSIIRDGNHIISKARLLLPRGIPEEILQKNIDAIKKRSSNKIKLPNCGSVFKNPAQEKPAGMLIDRAGMKGFSCGGLRVSHEHSNYFENTGGATYDDFCRLEESVKKKVYDKFSINLELEVKVYC